MGSDKGRFLVIFLLTMVVSHYGDDGRLDVTCGGWGMVQHPCSVVWVSRSEAGRVRPLLEVLSDAPQALVFLPVNRTDSFCQKIQGVYIDFHTLDVAVLKEFPFRAGHLGVLFRKMGFWFMF